FRHGDEGRRKSLGFGRCVFVEVRREVGILQRRERVPGLALIETDDGLDAVEHELEIDRQEHIPTEAGRRSHRFATMMPVGQLSGGILRGADWRTWIAYQFVESNDRHG